MVRRCAEEDPSIAVEHNWLWELHPAIAWRWELRLQLELGRPVALPDEQSRAHFLQQHSSLAQDIVASELKRQLRQGTASVLDLRYAQLQSWSATAITNIEQKARQHSPVFQLLV